MANQHEQALEPAIIVVESPWSVCKLEPEVFAAYPCRKIILVDHGQRCETFFAASDLVLSCALMDRQQLTDIYRRLVSGFQVLAVIGFSETSVFATAFLADAFGVRGIGLPAALACRNKHTMLERLSQAEVATPDYFLVAPSERFVNGTLAEKVVGVGGFPVICKPLMGFAGCGVIRADDLQQLHKAIGRIRRSNRLVMARYYDDKAARDQVLVQRCIRGTEIAVDGYVYRGQAHILSIIDKPDVSQGPFFSDNMHILPSSLPERQRIAIATLTQSSVISLGLEATPFHLEARYAGGRFYVLEVAARIGFMHSIKDALGLDLCAITLALKMGTQPALTPTRQRFAGNYCITARRMGFFAGISNTEAVLADPRIVAMPLFVAPGDRVAPPPEGNSYIGFVLAAADSYEEVEDALTRASQNVRVVLE